MLRLKLHHVIKKPHVTDVGYEINQSSHYSIRHLIVRSHEVSKLWDLCLPLFNSSAIWQVSSVNVSISRRLRDFTKSRDMWRLIEYWNCRCPKSVIDSNRTKSRSAITLVSTDPSFSGFCTEHNITTVVICAKLKQWKTDKRDMNEAGLR